MLHKFPPSPSPSVAPQVLAPVTPSPLRVYCDYYAQSNVMGTDIANHTLFYNRVSPYGKIIKPCGGDHGVEQSDWEQSRGRFLRGELAGQLYVAPSHYDDNGRMQYGRIPCTPVPPPLFVSPQMRERVKQMRAKK